MPPDMQFQLGSMDAKLDTLVRRAAEDRQEVAELKARVTELEKWKWTLVGAASAAGGVASYITKVLTS